MKQPPELTRIIKSVRQIVNHEEDVLGYKTRFKTSEVKEALEDLGYMLVVREGSKKEKVFYHRAEDGSQNWVPAEEGRLLDEVGGYILSRRELEKYPQRPAAGNKRTAGAEMMSKLPERQAGQDLEDLFFSYPDKIFLRDLEEDEPETKFQISDQTRYLGKIALGMGVATAAVFCIYLLTASIAREMPTANMIFQHLARDYH